MESGCATSSALYCRYLSYTLNCEVILNSVVDPRKTNILVMISSMQGMRTIGSKETNIIAVIPRMHRIIFARSGAASLKETSILTVVPVTTIHS